MLWRRLLPVERRGVRPRLLLALAGAILVPQVAEAHLVVTGMGAVYDGISHFGLSPEDSLPVGALALYAGLRGPVHARLLMATLPIAWLTGGLMATLSGAALPPILLPAITAVILLGIGGLLASNLEAAPTPCAVVAAVLGLVRGAADLEGAAATGASILTLLGMCASVFAVFALAASVTLPLRRFWMIIAARVTGSWLAAVGLLLAGWIMRYGARVQ
jgi:urease accessory protein